MPTWKWAFGCSLLSVGWVLFHSLMPTPPPGIDLKNSKVTKSVIVTKSVTIKNGAVERESGHFILSFFLKPIPLLFPCHFLDIKMHTVYPLPAMLTHTIEGKPIPTNCEYCGKKLPVVRKVRSGRPKRFCGSTCLTRSWRKNNPRKKISQTEKGTV